MITNAAPRYNGTATTTDSTVAFPTPDQYRTGITFCNTGSVAIYLGYDEAATTSNFDGYVAPMSTVVLDLGPLLALHVIVLAGTCSYSAKEKR